MLLQLSRINNLVVEILLTKIWFKDELRVRVGPPIREKHLSSNTLCVTHKLPYSVCKLRTCSCVYLYLQIHTPTY